MCFKVRYEAKESLWPWSKTGRQTAGCLVVRLSSSLEYYICDCNK